MFSITYQAITKNRITFMAMIVILFMGTLSYFRLPRAEDPGFVVRKARVVALFPGASPERMENLVTDPLEEAILEMPEIEFINSQSSTGLTVINVKILDEFKTMRPIWDTLRRKVDRVQPTLPKGVKGPFVNDEFGDVFGTFITIQGEGYSYKELHDIADQTRNELLKLDEVAKVELYGNQEERIFVEYEDALLADMGGSTSQLKRFLENRNIIIPGGSLFTDEEEIILEPSGNFETYDQLRNSIINVPGKKDVLYLKDFANISRGYVDPPAAKLHDTGTPAIGLAVSMRENGNIIRLGEEVQELIDQVETLAPIGIHFSLALFQPGIVDQKVNDFVFNLSQSVLIVLVVMLISLGFRVGMVVASLIPLAILSTFWMMDLFNVGIDQTSLAALIISLGMLVDNSIVMSESILYQIKEGKKRIDAAVDSAKELYIPLLTSSLTTSAAFLPIFLAQSVAGEYTASLFKVVTIALLSSWLLSLTVIPMFCVLFLKRSLKQPSIFSDNFFSWYRQRLLNLLRWPKITMAGFFLAFVLAILSFQWIPKSFFPPSDRPLFSMEIEFPVGTKFTRMETVVKELEEYLKKNYLVENDSENGITQWISFYGGSAPRYLLNYQPEAPRPEKAILLVETTHASIIPDLIEQIERETPNLFPDMRITFHLTEHGPPVEAPVAIRISANNLDELYTLRKEVKQQLSNTPGIKNINDNWGEKSKKIAVKINQPRALRAGITNKDVAISLQTMLSGFETTQFREVDETIPVTLRSVASNRNNIDRLESLNVYSQNSTASVPLKQVADIELGWEPHSIFRRNRDKTITVTTDVESGVTPAAAAKHIQPWLDQMSKEHEGHARFEIAGEIESARKSNESIAKELPIAAVLILFLLVCQFNSFRLPLIICLTIPLGIIGVALGLVITQSIWGFMTLLGIVSLSGIVINNAIVLLDRILIEQNECGKSPQEAILDASIRRIRPILLTTLTTIGGLLPLWFGGGALFSPMAVTIIFGLLFATLLTLGFVPVLYSLLYGVRFTAKALPPTYE